MKKIIKKVKSIKPEKMIQGTNFNIKVSEVNTTLKASNITKLEYDFGRGDFNLMRDKINEIIEHVN